jgi:1A family penicillin-binding protein
VWIRRHWPALLLLAAAIAGVAFLDVWLATCAFEGCPSGSEIRAFKPAEGGRVLDRNGRFMGRLTMVRRVNVPLAKVPEHVRTAFIATEDRRFYKHNGLDWRGFARAAARNLRAGGVREGFSTISMQVARNTFVVRKRGGRTLRQKLLELRVARLIEANLTKNQILEHYLNVIYLGNGVYGVEAASRDLFGKSVNQLTVAEAAVLAALPKGPSYYTPRKSRSRAQARRDLVISLMRDQGYLDAARAEAAKRAPLRVAAEEWRPEDPSESYALDLVRALVDSALGDAEERQSNELTVYTTLDLTAQTAADRTVRRYAGALGRNAQGAMVAVDPRSGDIRALSGGRVYERKTFNRAVAARRQPGSAFKPFVYAAALSSGLSPATLVDDEPIEVTIGRTVWSPANFGDQYNGRITLWEALLKSANAATVRVSRSLGEGRVVQQAKLQGISSPLTTYPAVALGASEVTPLELVTAYSPFANGGYRVRPRLVRRIEAADGTPLWSSEITKQQVMDARDAYQLTEMMEAVVDHGTAHSIRDRGVKGPVAGKTGTTNSASDVWFIGYTPTVVAGFWFGYDQPRPMGDATSGGRIAAPAWADFYLTGWRERTPAADQWQPPAGMVEAEIDPTTGELANEWCPIRKRAWFKPGSEPRTECHVHFAPQPDAIYTTEAGQVETQSPQRAERAARGGIGRILRKIFKF